MRTGEGPGEAHKSLIILAFAAIYVVWGSTYLAIRIGVESLPPLLMAGVRFLLAGGVMLAVARWRGAAWPTGGQWKAATFIGALLLLGGNGSVTWAEQTVPSGIAALLVTTVPLWVVVMNWVRRDGVRPPAWALVGVSLGFSGVALLIGPQSLAAHGPIDRLGAGVLLFAAFSWSLGSLCSRHVNLPPSPWMATAAEMLAGGLLLLGAGTLLGEWGQLDPAAVSLRSTLALLYLALFGSIVAFTAYIWLLQVSTPTRVATYAYVNPVVAVVLGHLAASEPLTWGTAAAMVVIVTAVVIITRHGGPSEAKREPTTVTARAETVLPPVVPATAPAASLANLKPDMAMEVCCVGEPAPADTRPM